MWDGGAARTMRSFSPAATEGTGSNGGPGPTRGLPSRVCLLDYPEGVGWPSPLEGRRVEEMREKLGSLDQPRPWPDVSRNGTVSGVQANGYTLVNLAGSYDLGDGVSAYARIDNLFDRRYQDPTGFLRPGLGVFAGVRLALDAAGTGR